MARSIGEYLDSINEDYYDKVAVINLAELLSKLDVKSAAPRGPLEVFMRLHVLAVNNKAMGTGKI